MAEKKKKKSPNMLVGETSVMNAGFNRDYRAEDDHRTLTRAGEVMSDRERMKAAKEHAKKQQKHMEKVCK
jgi:hypothetical protein